MIDKLIEASVRNRYLVLAVTAVLAAFAVYTVFDTPVDAIPDLSENQVIVFTDWMGRSPKEIEDQATYPLSLKLQGLAGVKAVRSSSEPNFSMITVIFEDGIDFYFARQRVSERLALASTFLPEGVVPRLAPDSTALGQIFWYTLDGGALDPGRRWALQRSYVGPQLGSVPGVAEVGSVGGMPQEYQIDVDPNALRAFGVTLGELTEAVARSNSAVGGQVIQKNNAEYLVRGVGWIEKARDLEDSVITQRGGTPITVKQVASVQLGTQFRRGVLEKDGNEAVGGVVLMRFGENPLAVTDRIKKKIQELQPGLPEGVRIVPAYDRTRLIHGAIETLGEVMWHEMLIAAVAILLILMHLRSVFVICVTLPLSVLFSFLMMWLLRRCHVVDVQANIMSLAGLTISIGILVDQAIVMVENATHHLKKEFGDRPVAGNTQETVIRACRTVGRPIFFSVLIILISFAPIFAMTGREGKMFHPMALTKSLAMVGVALLSVTVVPALIPLSIRGRLRSEEDNWIVRSFIQIYRPVLVWALDRFNLVMWLFGALLIVAAGMFPLQAVLGIDWKAAYLLVLAIVLVVTVLLMEGWAWQVVGFASLAVLGLWSFHLPKIGVEFMPPLTEGTAMDMPITVPRASVTETADDLKARDALVRQFPEVESVIGKSGRADTPTDPAPLDMVETFVNFRPREWWPKRGLAFEDAALQARRVLAALEERGYLARAPSADDRDALVNDATMTALTQFDETMRALALQRYREFERQLGPELVRFAAAEMVRHLKASGRWRPGTDEAAAIEDVAAGLAPDLAASLARCPALEDVGKLTRAAARQLSERATVSGTAAEALAVRDDPVGQAIHVVGDVLGRERPTMDALVLEAVSAHRAARWSEHVRRMANPELFDRGVEAYTWAALEELARSAKGRELLAAAPHGAAFGRFLDEAARAARGKDHDAAALAPFVALRQELEKPFARTVLFWRRTPGPKGDLLQEMDGTLQVPGWSNIWTQPIANRIDMLATGVRTQIGVKVFGPDLAAIDRICKQVEQALKPIAGARDVLAEPIMGKGYLEIIIDRARAARYGLRVGDIQDTIEVALGGRVITQTVEGRDRFPVRVRYARDFRDDEQAVKRLLVSRGVAMGPPASNAMADDPSAGGPVPLQVPLGDVADVRIVEGPAMIKSENGRLRNYVTLNVRDRDVVGFVEEAMRVVAAKVPLPEGTHLEWSGEFEHQVRAARTLRFILPAVLMLIFAILYLTYHDLTDAGLMMLAVPEALAGGVFFQVLFPKMMHGWSAPPVDFSVAVWVGYIAAFGMATETGIIMLVYLREAIDQRGGLERIGSLEELRQAVIEGAVHRLRPKLLTEGVAIVALAPMLFATGVGGEIISVLALPVMGGLLIADEVVDVFLPVRFYHVRRARWLKLHQQRSVAVAAGPPTDEPAGAVQAAVPLANDR